MRVLPTGVLTYLFCDVEGSTRLARTLGDQIWAECLEQHRSLLSRAVAAFGGIVVDAEGDGLFVVFESAADAVAAAVAGQRILAQQAWPNQQVLSVRMGLHTGKAALRGESYAGYEVHRASRVCSSAHGGQVVLSHSCAESVRESGLGGVALLDLGVHRLKDLDGLHRLYQLRAPGLKDSFPRLRALPTTQLPVERSTFVGRQEEIAAITEMLGKSKLVTLIGVGGCGKTRLALKVASSMETTFWDGIYFVDLAAISDSDLLAPTVASACRLSLGGTSWTGAASVLDAVVAALARLENILIVLDNCEHLIEPVAELADRVLGACLGVTLLTTSREATGVDGERIMQVQPLPTGGDTGTQTEAAKLFVERARECRPGLDLDESSSASIEEICRKLDGIPLAIEFAAARVSHMTIEQIEARLERRFQLLSGGRRRVHRQQTLAAALDWSYDLLSEPERALFRQLAVFTGEFSLDAAEAVCDPNFSGRPVYDVLASLISKSLVTTRGKSSDQVRYRMLETLRAYATEMLIAAGEHLVARDRHCSWCLAWLTSPLLDDLGLSTPAFELLQIEIENLRTAFDWSMARENSSDDCRIACRLYGYWWATGQFHEGRRRVLECLERGDQLNESERLDCHAAIGGLSTLHMGYDFVVDHCTQGVSLAKDRSRPLNAAALSARAFVHAIRAASSPRHVDAEFAKLARRDIAEAQADARSRGSDKWLALVLAYAACVETTLDDHAAAARIWSEIISIQEGTTDPSWAGSSALSGLATSYLLLDRIPQALEAANRYLSASPPHGDRLVWWRHTATLELVPIFAAANLPDVATELLHEGARKMRGIAMQNIESHLVCIAGAFAFWTEKPHAAARLLSASIAIANDPTVSPFLTPAHGRIFAQTVARVRARLSEQETRSLREQGRRMSVEEALRYALSDSDWS